MPIRACRSRAACCAILFVSGLLVPPEVDAAADISEATALLKSGKYDECSQYTQAAIEDGRSSETWRTLKIQADLARGRYEEALAALESALERFQSSVRLRWLGSHVYRLNDQPNEARKLLDEIDVLTDGYSWRYSDPPSRVTLGRYYLQRGADAKQIVDSVYNQVKKRSPSYTDAYIAAGELALDKHDYGLAAEQFEAALKHDATDPAIHFGLARAYANSDAEKSESHLKTALVRNPQHVDTLLLVADNHIDAERYEQAAALLRTVVEINSREPRAWAYLAVLAHLRGDQIGEDLCRQIGLQWWRQDPRVDHLIGNKLSQKYRFAEGAAYQRRALQFDEHYLPAKFQLSQDLLRLGQDEEGWQLALEVHNLDGYNVVAHNLVTLQDNLTKFRILESAGFVVRMEAREAELYGARVLQLLERARQQLCTKYDVSIDEPVRVEIFPNQADFAIRTFGLPGGDGFLGVCFGRVITANSPASQGGSPSNWESVLWHEFCHVVTLEKTRNKMPRWLSEGISVYEELQADSTWGQSMTPRYREMILGDDLTPVSQLSGAFLRPASPMHLQFAYYESALVVEFLVQEYGLETLKRILVDLSVGMPINESLGRYAGSLAALDQDFAEFARRRATEMAPDADWNDPELPRRASSSLLAAWVQAHPNNFAGLQQWAAALMRAEKWQDAKQPLEHLIELFPEHHESDNAYAMLAAVHRKLGETQDERAVLERLAAISSDAVEVYLRLLELSADEEDWSAVARYAEQLLAVNPLVPAPHRYLARAAEQTGQHRTAIDALRALLVLDTIDPADTHYRLARLLRSTGELPEARRHILMSLEEAPRFRAAHRELLGILRKIAENESAANPPRASNPETGSDS